MSEPVIAGRTPVKVELQAGRRYWWCACGLSATQPFCDGSHKGGPFAPVELRPTETRTVHLCACKRTRGQPFCDGSHKQLAAETA